MIFIEDKISKQYNLYQNLGKTLTFKESLMFIIRNSLRLEWLTLFLEIISLHLVLLNI